MRFKSLIILVLSSLLLIGGCGVERGVVTEKKKVHKPLCYRVYLVDKATGNTGRVCIKKDVWVTLEVGDYYDGSANTIEKVDN
ncbi:MAG: hypothetical protein LC778_10350 [Acidobacteria bacterium]|nr:hypothetical protein [Acidobacteriota bacterium]